MPITTPTAPDVPLIGSIPFVVDIVDIFQEVFQLSVAHAQHTLLLHLPHSSPPFPHLKQLLVYSLQTVLSECPHFKSRVGHGSKVVEFPLLLHCLLVVEAPTLFLLMLFNLWADDMVALKAFNHLADFLLADS